MFEVPAARFPTTRWSLLARARDADPLLRREALEQLLRSYWRPIREYLVACRGMTPDRADDLVQGFIARRVLEQDVLAGLAPEKGRFRTFLVKVLNWYVSNELREERAQKRGGGAVVALEENGEPEDPRSGPAQAMEAAWARRVLEQAVELMRGECARARRPGLWEVFEGRVLGPATGEAARVPYDELVARLGLESPAQACNLLVTAKRLFIRCLRQVVAGYETDDRLIDEEIAELRRALGRR